MSSLFSRNRTTSKATPPTSQHLSADIGVDDFGRVTSRGKDKDTGKKSKKDKERSRTISDVGSRPASEATQDIPDGVFLGTSLQPPPLQTPDGAEPYKVSEQPYGHLAAENHVILGLDDACRLVAVIAQELSERGLATPLLFSSSALDINPSMTRRLIVAFIRTCSSPQSQDGKWREEARFAGPHELAMVLRWGLARIVRMDKGQEVHGLLRWELYVSWRTHEHAAAYDPNHFITLLPSVPPQVRMILTTLLDLLSRLIAHAQSNGLTPPSLAALFGPLLFGLGPLTQGAFQLAYTMYLRSVNATEHIILNYIRYQEAQETVASTLPARLKDWTRNYHGMIPPVDKLDRARIGARTVRLASIRRNVRLYSPDLVKTAASWATRGDNALANSKEWSKIVPPSHKLQPKYSDAFRKRMDLPPSFQPDLGPGANLSSSSSTVSTISSIGTLGPSSSESSNVSVVSDDHRFRSLTDMRWGEFESIGFLSGNDKALEFDLTEGARKARDEKRGTMSWSDFSSEGFSRTNEPLSATLQFSAPLATQVNQWPSQNAELQRKLKKAQKSLPAFGWDTEPVLGAEEVIEESFVDCFCDLIYGSGWMDRSEGTFRDCNWALVEFKSLPQQRPTLVPQGDPRTGSMLLLFEEFVPLEYRAQLSAPKKKMRFFLPAASKKQWKPAPTMNGRPYVVGTVNGAPRAPNTEKRNEFEDLLRTSAGVTKVLTIQDAFPTPLAIPKERNLSNLSINRSPDPAVTLPSPLPTPKAERKPLPQSAPTTPASPINRTSPSQQPPLPAKTLAPKTSLFNLSKNKRGGMMYDTAIEFEAHTESEGSSDEAPAPPSASKRPGAMAKDSSKRLSRDDAWVDILIGDNRRMDNQAAEMRRPGAKPKTSPDAAREEIARALASVGQRPPDDDDIIPAIKPSFEMRPSTDEGDHNRRESYPYPAPAIPRHSTDDEDDDDRYGAPEPRDPRINVRPPTVISMPSPESNDFEPLDDPEVPVSPPSSPPSMALRSPAARPHPAGPRQPGLSAPRAESPQPSRSPSPSGRRPIPPAPEPAPAPKAALPKGKTGVSSLIEMYREREKGGSPKKKDEAPAPSRLPVRAPTNTNN